MARNRNARSATPVDGPINSNIGGRKMAGLTPEQIAALLGKTRQKGVYTDYLNSFIASGEGGIDVNEQYVDLRDKKPSTLKQGFENAKDKKEAHEDANLVKVVSDGTHVFLINLKVAGAVPEAEAEAA